MTRHILSAMLAAALMVTTARGARAGTWEHTFLHFAVGGPGNFFGTATTSTDSNGNAYVSFASGSNQFATAEFTVPSYLTAPQMTCQVNFRINSSATNHVRFKASVTVTTTGALWEFNDGTGLLPTVGSQVTLDGHAKDLEWGSITNIPFCDQIAAPAAQCASTLACSAFPARFRISRDDSVSSNDPAAAEVISVFCTAPSS